MVWFTYAKDWQPSYCAQLLGQHGLACYMLLITLYAFVRIRLSCLVICCIQLSSYNSTDVKFERGEFLWSRDSRASKIWLSFACINVFSLSHLPELQLPSSPDLPVSYPQTTNPIDSIKGINDPFRSKESYRSKPSSSSLGLCYSQAKASYQKDHFNHERGQRA